MFVEVNLEKVIALLNQLDANQQPKWGKMTAQEMIEHLTDTLKMAIGDSNFDLVIPEEKIERMQQFLYSDKEMMQNIEVPFAPKERTLRNEELETAIDEFVEAFITFEETFEENNELETLHPFYGNLNYEKWKLLNQKHLTHHFKQFGLID
jgi:hypothetical protein